MTAGLIHPATIQLLWLQSRGRTRRIEARFRQPRRLILSALAVLLGVVWLGNAALAVWLREPAATDTLRAFFSLGLTAYVGWHFMRAALFRPQHPFDWSATERDILTALPLNPRELVMYQLASVALTTVLKAALFTLLLLPDLRCLPLGFVGVLLAMMVLEVCRTAIDIVTWGLPRKAFVVYRLLVVVGLVLIGFLAGTVVVRENALRGVVAAEGIRGRIVDTLIRMNASELGYATQLFQPFVELITADRMTSANLALATADAALVTALGALVIGLFVRITRHVAAREQRDYRPIEQTLDESPRSPGGDFTHEPRADVSAALRQMPRWGGAGALAWRQLLGARRHWGSLLTAMIAPAVLAAAPCFVIADPAFAFLSTTGALVFYSFLLLPTALRFDFRRDLERMLILKGLPITPAATVLGQTIAPILIATVFQAVVLLFAVLVRSTPPAQFLVVMAILIPLNVCIFTLDNLIFLLYPYRLQQEGLEVFLRTLLTFTGKSILFAAGLFSLSGWGFAAGELSRAIASATGFVVPGGVLFVGGTIWGISLVAVSLLWGLCRTYRALDPIEDLPRA